MAKRKVGTTTASGDDLIMDVPNGNSTNVLMALPNTSLKPKSMPTKYLGVKSVEDLLGREVVQIKELKTNDGKKDILLKTPYRIKNTEGFLPEKLKAEIPELKNLETQIQDYTSIERNISAIKTELNSIINDDKKDGKKIQVIGALNQIRNLFESKLKA